MTEKKKQEYNAPMVELLDARLERGFQMSGVAEDPTGGTEALTNSGNGYGSNDFD